MAKFRSGRKVGNTLYRDDVFIGSCVSPEHAAEIVAQINAAEGMAKALESVPCSDCKDGVLYCAVRQAALAQWREATGVRKESLPTEPAEPIQHSVTVPLPSGREIHNELVARDKKKGGGK